MSQKILPNTPTKDLSNEMLGSGDETKIEIKPYDQSLIWNPGSIEMRDDSTEQDIKHLVEKHNCYGTEEDQPSAYEAMQKITRPNQGVTTLHEFEYDIKSAQMDDKGAIWIGQIGSACVFKGENDLKTIKGAKGFNGVNIKLVDSKAWVSVIEDASFGKFYHNNCQEGTESTIPEGVYFEKLHKDMKIAANENFFVYSETHSIDDVSDFQNMIQTIEDGRLQRNAKYLFENIVSDQQGFYDEKQLKEWLQWTNWQLGRPKPTDAEVREYMNKYDTNNDDKIDFDEFQAFFLPFIEQFISVQTDGKQKISIADMRKMLEDPEDDASDAGTSLEAKVVRLVVLDRSTLDQVVELQVRGLTSFVITTKNLLFTMTHLLVCEVWQLSQNATVKRIYSIDPRHQSFDFISQATVMHESFICEKVAIFSNFEQLDSSKPEDMGQDSGNLVTFNEDWAVLFWRGQDRRVDIISLETLQTLRSVHGEFVSVGLTKTRLVLLDEQKISFIDKNFWYDQACWDLNFPIVNHLVCNQNSEKIFLVMNHKQLVELCHANDYEQYSCVDFKFLPGVSTEPMQNYQIQFVGHYAISKRGDLGIDIIDFTNPQNTKFIERKCTQLYSTKEYVIGLFDQYDLRQWAIACNKWMTQPQSDEWEQYMQSELFYLDPASGEVYDIQDFSWLKEQGWKGRVTNIACNDYAISVSATYQFKELPAVAKHHTSTYFFNEGKIHSYNSALDDKFLVTENSIKLELGNSMELVAFSPHYNQLYFFNLTKENFLEVVAQYQSISETTILCSHPWYLVTKSQNLCSICLYDSATKLKVLEVDFPGVITVDHLSDDKCHLYLLITKDDADQFELHVLNFKKLRSYKIGNIPFNYTQIKAMGQSLVLIDQLSGMFSIIPFEYLVSKRFYDYAKYLEVKSKSKDPNQIEDQRFNENYEELKDIVIYPTLLDLSHFWSYYNDIAALREFMKVGMKIGATTDGCSALSILLSKKGAKQIDAINEIIGYMMNDEILEDMDINVCDRKTKIKIIQHLEPLENCLLELNKTQVPNLKLVYEKGFIMSETKVGTEEIKIDEEVIEVIDSIDPQQPQIEEQKSTQMQKVEYLISVIKHNVNIAEQRTVDFMGTLLGLEDEQILSTETVKNFSYLCWRKAMPYIIGLGVFHLLFTIAMAFHITNLLEKQDSSVIIYLLWIFEGMCLVYSFMEIVLEKIQYFTEFWNWIDIIAHVFTLLYLISDATYSLSPIILALSNLFIWFRLISFVRVSRRFSYYIYMIIQILKGMLPFLMLLMLFSIGHSFGLMALVSDETWDNYWMISYQLMFASFENDYLTNEARSYFVLSSIIGSLVMLNLIIAIISDLYDEAQSKIEVATVRERLSLIREVGQFLVFFKFNSTYGYMHSISTEILKGKKGDADQWIGKVNELKREMKLQLAYSEKNLILKIEKQDEKFAKLDQRIEQIIEMLNSRLPGGPIAERNERGGDASGNIFKEYPEYDPNRQKREVRVDQLED